MLTLQERRSRFRVERTPVEIEDDWGNDNAFENELIALLGRMENVRERLAVHLSTRQSDSLLGCASDMIGEVTTFTRDKAFVAPALDVKTAALRVKEFDSALRLAQQAVGQATEAEATRACFAAMHDAILTHLSLFTTRFTTSAAARSWVDVGATFVVELKKLIQISGTTE